MQWYGVSSSSGGQSNHLTAFWNFLKTIKNLIGLRIKRNQ